MWDCQSGQARSSLWGHTGRVMSVCTEDGRLIISGSEDATIRMWDLNTGEQIVEPIENDGSVYVVALSNNGRIVAAVGQQVCVWDMKTSRQISLMTGHTSTVYSVALSPDNRRIASGSADGIRLWDAQTYTQIGKFNGHKGIVLSVSFSHDGRSLASGTDDMTVRV